nr:ABC transporter permease [Govania unica]
MLIWAGLTRKRTRLALTLLSVMAAFALFGFLDAVRVAFNATDRVVGIDRLIVASRLSLIQPLPASYLNRIRSTPGVAGVASGNWFGGIYQDPKNFFPNIAISGQSYLDIYPEILLTPEERLAFTSTRTGAIVGETLAKRFGWKVGDKIPLQATIFPNKSTGNTWTFDLVGIFHTPSAELRDIEQNFFFRYDYFDEGRSTLPGTVGWYIVKVSDPKRSEEVAQAIDRMFRNSSDETKTQSEREFQLSFAKQIGDIGLIVSAIMGAVFFTLVILTGNTMSQSFRERIPEFAVLKTLGFTNRQVLWLVLAEAVLLMLLGGIGGLLLARAALPLLAAATGGQMVLPITMRTVWTGFMLMIAIGIMIGVPPALRAMRLKIVDALAGR